GLEPDDEPVEADRVVVPGQRSDAIREAGPPAVGERRRPRVLRCPEVTEALGDVAKLTLVGRPAAVAAFRAEDGEPDCPVDPGRLRRLDQVLRERRREAL